MLYIQADLKKENPSCQCRPLRKKASAPASALNSLRGHPSAPSAIIHALARKTLHRRHRYLGGRPRDNDSSVVPSAVAVIRCDAQPPARASLAASKGDSSSPRASPPVSPVCQACVRDCVRSLLLAFFPSPNLLPVLLCPSRRAITGIHASTASVCQHDHVCEEGTLRGHGVRCG